MFITTHSFHAERGEHFTLRVNVNELLVNTLYVKFTFCSRTPRINNYKRIKQQADEGISKLSRIASR